MVRPLLKGALLPLNLENVPVNITVSSEPSPAIIYKSRTYHLPNGQDEVFLSSMKTNEYGELIEHIGCGIHINLDVYTEAGDLYFQSLNYFLELGFFKLPIPSLLSPRKTLLQHIDLDGKRFSICIEIVHPWFGVMFKQSGEFVEIG